MRAMFRTYVQCLVVFLGATPALGMSKQITPEQLYLEHNGLQRMFHVSAPPNQTAHPPLIIALHGGGQKGKNFDRFTGAGLLKAAAEAGMMVVLPQAINKEWNDGRREEPRLAHKKWKEKPDDVGFISALIDHMIATYDIDPHRVYAVGCSNGGIMACRLAVELPERIAAVAALAAQLSEHSAGVTPTTPVSVMLINGSEDKIVPFNGGHISGNSDWGKILSSTDTVAFFRNQNHCSLTPILDDLPDLDPKDRTRVQRMVYGNGKNGAEVVLLKVIGGGHVWPRGRQYLPQWIIGRPTQDIDATQMIIDFFKKHPGPRGGEDF